MPGYKIPHIESGSPAESCLRQRARSLGPQAMFAILIPDHSVSGDSVVKLAHLASIGTGGSRCLQRKLSHCEFIRDASQMY
jgi:hypothetical protein